MSSLMIASETLYEAKSPFVDLSPWLDGEITPVVPTIGQAWEGRHLFYAEAINEIHGEPSVGKTNVLLVCAGSVLQSGGSVLYIDPEDTAGRIVSRAIALGIDRDSLRERFHYLQAPTADNIAKAQAWGEATAPQLVIIDGVAEMLAADNRDENLAKDYLSFIAERIRPFARAGAAVVVADHVVKSKESRGRWSRGTGAKQGCYDGISYEVVLGEAYAPNKTGFIQLKISKDRHGGVGPLGKTVAELHFSPSGGGSTSAVWLQPTEAGSFRPTAIMDKIVSYLSTHGEANKTQLRSLGKSQYVDDAITLLKKDEAITHQKRGNADVYTLLAKEQQPS
jgi:hypothetical protein